MWEEPIRVGGAIEIDEGYGVIGGFEVDLGSREGSRDLFKWVPMKFEPYTVGLAWSE